KLWPSTRIILITPPPIDEAARLLDPYIDNLSGLPERTNESAGRYAKQCLAAAAECGVPAIDLWTKMQQSPGWQKAYLRYLLPCIHGTRTYDLCLYKVRT
ncbi:UNVERIFIED_CONTAM: GDSL esterase/lipase, partial [Sesamum radiatum]